MALSFLGSFFIMTKKISAQHILVDHEFEALDILKKLEASEPFEKLANDYSNCPSSQQGGSLGEFSKGMMVREFEQVAFSLKVGEVSAPVKTRFGYHLIKRIS